MDTQPETTVYIGIGSNMGDRLSYCRQAVAAVQHHPAIHLIAVSSLYETAPVDYEAQESFYNAVMIIKTALSAMALLKVCQEIEVSLDKQITIPKGPRTIDLDLLFFGSEIHSTPTLVLPHPAICQRLFVLRPLAELTPEWQHPLEKKSMQTLLSLIPATEDQAVKKRFDPSWYKLFPPETLA